ncbi:MAG TPA: carboxypeptidase-like regulatory domain-containing protein [Bryobacteraceae bacterium]
MLNRIRVVLFGLAVAVFLATSVMWAQAIFATLTGVVTDPSGAVVSGAKIVLKDAASGSERNTVTDSQGFYTFASVPVGTYNLSIEAPGFQTYRANGIAMGGGERRNVNASLTVGSTNQTIEVTGTADILAPVDSGEKAAVLTTQQLQNFVQVGTNAAEYLKIMPGFGNQNGANNRSSYSGQVIGINGNGDAGSQSPLNNAFSYNGLPGNTLDIVADGAHVSDPGCNCDTPVNPNSDFLQEFRVQTSNFGADAQKGPMVITSVTKAGGSEFHGSGFFRARNYVLNSNDSFANATGVKRPESKFYYPGGSIGGPVLIPFTNFNKNHDKLFFFTGYEYFHQTLDTGVLNATVPTQEMRQGNFCNVATGEGIIYNGKPAVVPTLPGGGCQMPASMIDPGMQALMNLYPLPNTNGNGFNYAQAVVFNQNNQQWVVRGDYNVSDNTKVFVRYNLQREIQPFPVGLWWRQTNQVPYPTSIEGKNRSDSVTGTITHVFSPTMTNETVFAYTFVGFPNVFQDPSKVNPATVGFKENLLIQNAATAFQIPSFGGNGSAGEAALIFNPGGFEAGGASSGLYANKYMPSVSDTLTKVIGTHTLKVGFFYEWIRNAQPASNQTNGTMQFVPANNQNFSTQNAYADMLSGNLSSFTQANFNRINDIAYNTVEGFIQDSWKITRRLTIDAGLRITHFTPWSDNEGFGYSTFTPSLYQGKACASAPTFCGFQWHSRNSAVPLGGFATRAVFWQPRFGLAYDVTGKGNTVIRGGWGRFYYHSGQFTAGLDTAAGSASITVTPNSIGNKPLYVSNPNFTNLATLGFAGQPGAPGAVNATDDKQPYTDSYSFTISQRTPWRGLLELGYVGNQSHDLQSGGGFGSNVNLVPVGALFKPDPTGAAATDPFNATADNYRPFLGYQNINQVTHNLYANYNAFQLTWLHQGSRGVIQFNYTLGKGLGFFGGNGLLGDLNSNRDPFNLRNNYGVQLGDRRHIFNAAYSINLPSPVHDNKLLAGLVNGWQLSGTTQLQSGANLTGVSSNGNFNMAINRVVTIPGTTERISNQSILGTNAIQLNPIITCDPTSNLGDHQWINPSCFSLPTQTFQNGPTVLPTIYGPAFFNSDLGLFKNFQIKESMKLQFRIQANNFLNHPLWSMSQGNAMNLSFTQDASGKISQDNAQFGTAQYKVGQRIVQLAVKFYF